MCAECSLDNHAMKRILRPIADDEFSNTIMADMELPWPYAPYDGDVIAPTVQTRNELRACHQDRLSPYPCGM